MFSDPSSSSSTTSLIPSAQSIAGPTLLIPSLSSTPHPPWLAQNWRRLNANPLGEGNEERLVGYQLWAVEQFVTDREALLPVILVSSGDTSDSVSIERFVLSTRVYNPDDVTPLDAQETAVWNETQHLIRTSGARLSLTTQGYLPITSLPSLSPNLNLVLIPSGNFNEARQNLYLNINLRRLGLGGRSGLSLSPATPAQKLHFRQAFLFPIPAPSSSSVTNSTSTNRATTPTAFDELVLDLIKLVQNTLSLFGLGVVGVRSGEGAGWARETESWEGGAEWKLGQGDGILCDTTLSALSLFRVDIGEPLLRIPSDDAVLSPPLLAGLLSLVIAIRGKIIACSSLKITKNPFERREKFLRACQTFKISNSLPTSPPYLTPLFVSSLTTLFHQNRAANLSTKSKVSRALRHRIDASLSLVDPNLPLGRSSHKSKGEEAETFVLETLVVGLEKGLGGSTLGRLWGVIKKRERGGKGEGEGETEGGTTNEEAGFGRSVLRGVKERAGRAGKRFGVGESNAVPGPSESPVQPMPSSNVPHNAPTLLVPGSPVMTPTHRSRDSVASIESPATFASRLASALSTERESPLTRAKKRLAPPIDPNAISMNSSAGNSMTSLGLGPPPSLTAGGAKRKVLRRLETDVKVLEKKSESSVSVKGKGRMRRHSFNLIYDAPEPRQILSRRRLEMDVNLKMAAWNLKRREENLAQLVEALQIVNNSYGQALASLEAPLKTRTERLATLEQMATTLDSQTRLYSPTNTSTTAPLKTLKDASSRLNYAQIVLTDKLADVLEFERIVVAKVSTGGTIDVGTKLLGRERNGVRRLVGVMEVWGEWVRGLKERVGWHCRWRGIPGFRTAPESDGIKEE